MLSQDVLPPAALRNPVFPLQCDQLRDLQLYAYIGSTLPDSREAYEHEVELKPEDVKHFESNIDGILSVYMDIRGHTRHFRAKTFHQIVDIAATIAAYSETAPDYYECILASIENPGTAKSKLDVCLDDQAASASAMEEKTRKVIREVEQFNKATRNDHDCLLAQDKLLDMQLGQHMAKATDLKDKKKKLRNDSVAIRQTLPSWLRGLAKYNSRVKLIIEEMANTDEKLKLYLDLKSRSDDIVNHLTRITDLAASAITILNDILSAFGEIAQSLRSIKEEAAIGLRQDLCSPDIHFDAVKSQWKSLGERARQYVAIAYIVPSDQDG